MAGHVVSIWNALFVSGVAAGLLVFLVLARHEAALTHPTLRFLSMAYLSALAAQLFAYAFDVNTTMAPPFGRSAWEYYLSPVAGPKTLYGVIVMMPVSVAVATLGCRISLARALDLWTLPMLVVLAAARVGCFLQGCCFGMRSDGFGLAFPAGSPVWGEQRLAGLVAEGASWSLPVVPTQPMEAAVLGVLAVVCGRLATRSTQRSCAIAHDEAPAASVRAVGAYPDGGVFLVAVVSYSAFRFAVEFVRADAERGIYAGLATSQWIALIVLAASAVAARGIPSGAVATAADIETEEAARR